MLFCMQIVDQCPELAVGQELLIVQGFYNPQFDFDIQLIMHLYHPLKNMRCGWFYDLIGKRDKFPKNSFNVCRKKLVKITYYNKFY